MFTERQAEIAFGGGVLCAVLLAFALGEAVLQLRWQLDTDATDWGALREEIGVSDPEVSTYLFAANGTYDRVATNAQGFRGPDIPLPKPAGHVRVGVFGSSTVLGAELAEADSFPAQLVDQLTAKAPDCAFDYVSFSGPAYEVPDLRVLATRHTEALELDWIVLVDTAVGQITPALRPPTALHDTQFAQWLADHSLAFRTLSNRWANHRVNRAALQIDQSPSAALDSAVDAYMSDVAGIAATAPDLDMWLFRHDGLAGTAPAALSDLIWAQISDHTAPLTSVHYSDALLQVAPVPGTYLDPFHFSPSGAAMAADTVAQTLLDTRANPVGCDLP